MIVNSFIFFGCFGLIVEVIFTSIRKGSLNLIGHTSLWMFPIYAVGLTYGFDFIYYLIEDKTIRWLSYPLWIWGVEFLFWKLFSQFKIRAWDYNYLPKGFHWNGVISFVHFPLWVGFGILVEYIKNC